MTQALGKFVTGFAGSLGDLVASGRTKASRHPERGILFYSAAWGIIRVIGFNWRAGVLAVALVSASPLFAAEDLPDYEVHHIHTDILYGLILVPGLTPDMPIEILAKALTAIAEKEGLDGGAFFFATEESFKASVSASYAEANPGVLEAGLLGNLRDGRFQPSGYAHPEFYKRGGECAHRDLRPRCFFRKGDHRAPIEPRIDGRFGPWSEFDRVRL